MAAAANNNLAGVSAAAITIGCTIWPPEVAYSSNASLHSSSQKMAGAIIGAIAYDAPDDDVIWLRHLRDSLDEMVIAALYGQAYSGRLAPHDADAFRALTARNDSRRSQTHIHGPDAGTGEIAGTQGELVPCL